MFGEVTLEAVQVLEGGGLTVLADDDARRGELDLDLIRSPAEKMVGISKFWGSKTNIAIE